MKRRDAKRRRQRERYATDPEYRARKVAVACARATYKLQALRRDLYFRDGFICGICGDTIEDPNDGQAVHIDHIQPRAHGGTDEAGNLRLVHAVCNLRRGDGRGKEAWEWQNH